MKIQTRNQTVKFGDVVRRVRETEHNPLENGITRYVGLGDLDPESIQLKRWGDLREDSTSFTRCFREGQMLFARRRAYQRKAALAPFDGICSGDIIVMEAKPDKLLPDLLPFLIHTDGFFDYAMRTSAGSLSPRTKWSHLAKYEFTLPPLDEQRRIAEILWAVEDTNERYSNLVNHLTNFKISYWKEYAKNGDWHHVRIGSVAHITNGTTPSRKNEKYWNNGDIPWLPTGKVHDKFITQADEFITQTALDNCSLELLPHNTILVAMIGQGKTRGTVAYLEFEATINQNFAGIIPKQDQNSRYIYYALNNSYEHLRRFSHGSNQGALNCRLIEQFPIPLPPSEIQSDLANTMSAIDEQIQKTELHLSRLVNLKNSLIHSLLDLDKVNV